MIGYQTTEFPAFYSRTSGIPLTLSLDTTSKIAAFIHEKRRMNLSGGTIVANPIPAQFEITREKIEPAIEQAISEAVRAGVSGKELTPFLLKQMNNITGGISQIANKQLVLHNARVAANIAVDLAAIRKKHTFIAL